MIKHYLPILLLINTLAHADNDTLYSEKICTPADMPQIIYQLEDYDISAPDKEVIETAAAFGGTHLNYSLLAHPNNTQNTIFINKNSGVILINANADDEFDVEVTARNNCGSITETFSVEIDDEE